MKKMHKILLFLLSVYSLYAQECKSILEIETNRNSSMIFINDELIGYGKIKTEVTRGKYIITVKENIFRWNDNEIIDSININLYDKEYLIRYDLFDKIFVDSRPQDASIYSYDSLISRTPNYVNLIEYQTVSLRKNGLLKSVLTKELSPYNTIPLEFPDPKKNEIFSESDWFKVLMGTATVFGVVSAYFKIKADNRYDEYLKTKDPDKLNEVNRLDLYSGIAFGLLQVNFGYLIYKFLIE
jgi:hypothetical protein